VATSVVHGISFFVVRLISLIGYVPDEIQLHDGCFYPVSVMVKLNADFVKLFPQYQPIISYIAGISVLVKGIGNQMRPRFWPVRSVGNFRNFLNRISPPSFFHSPA
jgi:hypothetical protein